MTFWDQAGADVRFAEGPDDLAALAPFAGTVVVVDVLSYSTCVAVVVAGGSEVMPLPWRDERAAAAARGAGAVLAGPRSLTEPSLSPTSLRSLPAGSRLALPSPNGAMATLAAAEHAEVLVGCLRNATATARVAATMSGPIVLAAAGERWPDGRLRPALEDRAGAGAIATALAAHGLSLSAEAASAVGLDPRDCASARELGELGFAADVACAFERDASEVTAVFDGGWLVGR